MTAQTITGENQDKKSAPESGAIDSKSKVLAAYKNYVLEHGRHPLSVYTFAKGIGMEETEFYQFYSSVGAVKRDIWKDYFVDTDSRLMGEPAYQEYSAREKLFAFYYTLVEVLKEDRSYILLSANSFKQYALFDKEMKEAKDQFFQMARDIILEGVDNEEIVSRPLLTERYHQALWVQVMFVVNFWISDDSDEFQKTDTAIEKAVNLSFDLMGRNQFDALFDFGKFLFQSKF